MAKRVIAYLCTGCGADFTRWSGKCAACGEWNTLVEIDTDLSRKKGVPPPESCSLADVPPGTETRRPTGIAEFDHVCGGGLVPGSVLLLGGEPGIGKSTLALQVAGKTGALYVSGEESPAQLHQRALRIGIDPAAVTVTAETETSAITALADRVPAPGPGCVVIDSIQTLVSPDIPAPAGSVSQIRECAAVLSRWARGRGIPVILVGHITKDGAIAGPKLLEHIVDTVLYFEGDFNRDFRMIRAFKNRFGSVNEIGLFRMTGTGLEEVEDKNHVFLNPFPSRAPGTAVSAALEGSRTLLFEVQALVTLSSFSNPRRMADGIDANRLVLITAVLEKHAGLSLGGYDIFINISGGFTVRDTGADLAVAMAIASSFRGTPLPDRAGFLGELSLAGEVRPVTRCRRRVQEFIHAGYTSLSLSAADRDEAAAAGFAGTVAGVHSIGEIIEIFFA